MSTVQETRIYVGNISPDTTKTALKEAFDKVGNVSKLRMLLRRRKTIVYAFITFEAAADAKKAIGELNDTELDGNKLVVQEARPIDDEILVKRKENKKNNRKLKRQAQQQAKKEEDKKKEEVKTTEETESETQPKKKNSHRKRKGKKEEGSEEEAKPESTKNDAPAAAAATPEPAKKEVKKEGETKTEVAKKEKTSTKPERKKAEKKEVVDNKAKSSNKEESEEKSTTNSEDGEAKGSRISSETGVFVANLPFSAKTSDLQELFKNFNIKTAKIARGRQGRRSKGYGFVEAATVEDQQKILNEFKEVEFKERIITVKPLQSKSDDE